MQTLDAWLDHGGARVVADGELVEDLALRRLAADGWHGLHAEGGFWLAAAYLLLDLNPAGPVPWCAPLQATPLDWGRWGYGTRRVKDLRAAAAALIRWCEATGNRSNRGRCWIGALGTGLLLGGFTLALLPQGALGLDDGAGLSKGLLAAAAIALGASWCSLPLGRQPRQRLLALLLGPWLALALLVQGGLFSDRTPALRLALEQPALRKVLDQEPVQLIATAPLNDDDQVMVILLALATPNLKATPIAPSELQDGQLAWSRSSDLLILPAPGRPRPVLDQPTGALGRARPTGRLKPRLWWGGWQRSSASVRRRRG
jgi:hypothetical protein